MFVFGSAANADDSNDGGGRGKASPSVDVAPSFAFDTSSLPAVTATPTAKSVATTAATGGFKFSVPPSQDLAAAATEGGEAGVTAPLFGGTFQSRQELLGAGVKTETKHEEAIHGRQQQQNGGSLPDPVTEEELMNSGHKLPEGYTCPLCCLPIEPPIGKYSSLMPCCMKRICDGCIRALVNGEWETRARFAERPLQTMIRTYLPWSENVWMRRTHWQLASLPVHITTEITACGKTFQERSSCGQKRHVLVI